MLLASLRGRSGVGSGAVEQQIVVLFELGCRVLQGRDQRRFCEHIGIVDGAGEKHDALGQRLLRADQRKQRLVMLLGGHHLLQQHV